MKETTLGRVRNRIGAIAVLSLMMTGGLASASQADVIECTGYAGCEDYGYAGANGTMYWNMYSGHNCTNYVAYRLVALGMPNSRPWANNGKAGDWKAGAQSAGYIVNTTPVAGAVAWWAPNTGGHGASGHVAYVESVNGDGTISISEDNWGGNFYWKTVSLSSGVQFIHLGSAFDSVGVPSTGDEHQVGDVLEVEPGAWSPAPSIIQRQWYRDGSALSGQTGDSYELKQEDIGSSITVVETAYAQGRRATPSGSAPVVVTAQQFDSMAIANVLGIPHVGNELSADLDTSMIGFTTHWQWKRGTQNIPGANEQFYAPTTADLGSQISVAITLTRAGFQDKTITSAPTAAVEPAAVVMSAVTISGTAKVDSVLYADVDVTTAGATVSYQWKRNGSAISGAVNSYYGVKPADVGASITVTATASKATYDTTTKTSGAVTPGVATISMSGVTITGTARVGYTLYSNVSVSTAGTSESYQWYRNGTTLVGTSAKYSPTIYDNGAVISVKVTSSKSGYATAYRNSGSVSISPALMGTFYATIQGTNRVEYTLSSSVTSATAGVALTYYWKRGTTVVSTGTSYTLQPADIGQSITLTVKGTKAGYATSTTVAGAGTTAGYLSYSFSGSPAAISGTAKVSRVLTAVSALNTSGVTMRYQWYRNGSPMSTATGRTYTIKSTDKGARITVRIYMDKLGHQATSYLSAATATVVA